MIPAAHRDEIITTGISFLRALTEAYGSSEGMKLWDSMSSVLDPDIKGAVFFAMLTGEHSGIVILNGVNANWNKISVVKAIRNYSKEKFGLKEAVDLANALGSGNTIKLNIDPKKRFEIMDEFRNFGVWCQ